VATRAPVARVRVADRIAAHVADVHVARGERRRGLYVQVRARAQRRRAEAVALAPSRLPAGLDALRVIALRVRLSHQSSIAKGISAGEGVAMLRALAPAPPQPRHGAPFFTSRPRPVRGIFVRAPCADPPMEIEI